MDTRTTDLAALRKVKAELKKLNAVQKQIDDTERIIVELSDTDVEPGYYQQLATNHAEQVGEKCFREAEGKAKARTKIVATIATVINLGIFAYSVYMLWSAPDTEWIKTMDNPAELVDEASIYWVAHCLMGFCLSFAPWLLA